MTAVFVHGVPETWRVWDGIAAAVERTDVVTLALPGFDAPLPSGFVPDKEHYAAWIIAEIEKLASLHGPVDLVGHDWGSLLVQRVASIRPDLIRTWACGSGPVDEQYEWHDMAKAWQTPGVGEQVMEVMTPETLAIGLADEVGADIAAELGAHLDDTMKTCILGLYRSAITVGAEWQPAVDALGSQRPAAVIWGRDDSYAPVENGERLAKRVGGSLHVLDCGHFWPLLRPADAAEALVALWARA